MICKAPLIAKIFTVALFCCLVQSATAHKESDAGQVRLLLTDPYVPPYLTLPPTPELPKATSSGYYATRDGSQIWYGKFGEWQNQTQVPITFLHGGFANSDYWGIQIKQLCDSFPVLAIDSRGHGRSVDGPGPITYDEMTNDVVGVLDHLGISKTTVVGWSDGGIIALDLAMNFTSPVERIFAFGATYDPSNINTTIADNQVFNRYLDRTKVEYRKLNPHPNHLQQFETKMNNMWNTLPNWNEKSFEKIPTLGNNRNAPLIWIVDGADEEAVNRTTPGQLHDWIPNSGLMILPLVSHFPFLQDPQTFNVVLERFVEYK